MTRFFFCDVAIFADLHSVIELSYEQNIPFTQARTLQYSGVKSYASAARAARRPSQPIVDPTIAPTQPAIQVPAPQIPPPAQALVQTLIQTPTQTPAPQQHTKQTITTGTLTPPENIEQEIENANATDSKILIPGRPKEAVYFPIEWVGEAKALSCAINAVDLFPEEIKISYRAKIKQYFTEMMQHLNSQVH